MFHLVGLPQGAAKYGSDDSDRVGAAASLAFPGKELISQRIFLTPRGLESLHAGLATIERIETRLQELLGEGDPKNLRRMLRCIIHVPIRL